MITDQEALDAICRENLEAFTCKVFSILEPGTEFEYSWHIGCIAEHLEASFRGELKDLIINIAPRTLKSVQVAQIFPAWVMGKEPHHQFIGASYAHTLAERNVMRTRQIMNSEFYHRLFPSTLISDDQNQKDYFTTTQAAQYKGTGIGGTITGFGCFSGDTEVITDNGVMKISDIKIGINANQCLSFNHKCDILEWKDIEATRTILSDDIYEVRTRSTTIRCTGNHPFYIQGVGYIEARNLKEGQILVKVNASQNDRFGVQLLSETVPTDRLRVCQEGKKGENAVLVQQGLLPDGAQQVVDCNQDLQTMWERVQAGRPSRLQDKALQRKVWLGFGKEATGQGLSKLWKNVFGKIKSNSILFQILCRPYSFSTDEGCKQSEVQKRCLTQCRLQKSKEGCIRERQVDMCGVWCCKTDTTNQSSHKYDQNESSCSSHRRKYTQQYAAESSNSLYQLPHYSPQEDAIVMVERVCNKRIPVYDLQIADNHNFFANGILVHNCRTLLVDDPVNPKEAMSDTIRMNAISEIRSTLFSRFNKYSERRFVMIMQRLHDDDPTGNLIKDGGYHLLKLPAVAPKSYVISLGKREWKVEAGEYLTPRLDKEALDKLRTDLGDYHFAGQYMQEPVPVGGGMFKPEWIQFYGQGAIKPTQMNTYILVDPSGGESLNKKKGKLSDWTAMMVVGLAPDNNYYLLDMIRDRLNPTERIDTLFMLHRKWNDLCGKPPKVGYEKYGMMTDTHYIDDKKKRDAYNFQLIELGGTMAKEERIRRLIPDMQIGRWYIPQSLIYVDGEGRRFDLVQELLKSEMPTFPRARFDDMLDALSRIYDMELVFPKTKAGMVERARKAAQDSVTYSWSDY